jgi:signal transduction histidine kinase
LKYSPGGIVTLGARVENNQLRVWISDQGPALRRTSALLFSRFGRAPSPATEAGARSNRQNRFGLFLTKSLVEAHGGNFGCKAKSGAAPRSGSRCRWTRPA